MDDVNRHGLRVAAFNLRRRVEPKKLRAAFHHPNRRHDRTGVARFDARGEGEIQAIKPRRFQVAQSFGLLLHDGIERPERLLHVVIRGALVDTQLRGDLAVGGSQDSQVEGLLSAISPLGILTSRAVA